MKKIMITLMFAATMFMPYKTYSMFGSGANSSKALLSGVLVGVGSGLTSFGFESQQERLFTKNEVIAGSIAIPSLMYSFLDKNINSTLFAFVAGCSMYYSIEKGIDVIINARLKFIKDRINLERIANQNLLFSKQQIAYREAKLRTLTNLLIDRQKIREGSTGDIVAIMAELEVQRERFEPQLPQKPPIQMGQGNGLVGKSREMRDAARNFAEAAQQYRERAEAERHQYQEKNPGVWGKFKVFLKDAIDDWEN